MGSYDSVSEVCVGVVSMDVYWMSLSWLQDQLTQIFGIYVGSFTAQFPSVYSSAI